MLTLYNGLHWELATIFVFFTLWTFVFPYALDPQQVFKVIIPMSKVLTLIFVNVGMVDVDIIAFVYVNEKAILVIWIIILFIK